MTRTAGWSFSLGVVLLGSMLAIGGCADSMNRGPAMTDKGTPPMTDKGTPPMADKSAPPMADKSAPPMMDKGMQPAADKGMMGSDPGTMKDQGMTKDGTMQGGQGTMDKK